MPTTEAIIASNQDLDLIERVLKDEPNEFKLIIKKYKLFVSSTIAKYVPFNKIEELAHEVFVRAYRSLSGFSAKGEFSDWLRTICVRVCHDFWRNEYKRKDIEISVSDSVFSNSSDNDDDQRESEILSGAAERDFQEQVEREETVEILKSGLDKLPPEERMVLTMTALEGYSLKEVAEQFGWGESKAKVRAYRARLKLRKILEEFMK